MMWQRNLCGGWKIDAQEVEVFLFDCRSKIYQLIKSNLKQIKIWVPFKFSSDGSSIINKGILK